MPGKEQFNDHGGFVATKLLFSTDDEPQLTDVMLAQGASDPDSTTTGYLQEGLVLGKIQDGSPDDGKYQEFDDQVSDGRQLSADVVVLFHDVRDIDQEDKKATVLTAGHVKEGQLINGADVDWDKCQRIIRHS